MDMDLGVAGLDRDAVDALRRAGFDHLSPDGQAYLRGMLQGGVDGVAARSVDPIRAPLGGAERGPGRGTPVDLTALGAGILTGHTFGTVGVGLGAVDVVGHASPPRGGATPTPSVDDLAYAAVQIAYRAAPRRWSEVGDAEAKVLDTYPARGRVPVLAEVAYPGLDAEALGPLGFGVAGDGSLLALHVPSSGSWRDAVDGTPITSVLGEGGTPSAAAEETFRKLLADWDAFGRVGVGGAALPALAGDAARWRSTRDGWLTGRMSVLSVGDALDAEVARAIGVRRALRENGVVDVGSSGDVAEAAALRHLQRIDNSARLIAWVVAVPFFLNLTALVAASVVFALSQRARDQLKASLSSGALDHVGSVGRPRLLTSRSHVTS